MRERLKRTRLSAAGRCVVAVVAIVTITVTVTVAITIARAALFAAARVLFGLRHRRGLGHRAVHRDDEVPDHGIAEAEGAGQLIERLLIALDVHQHVMRLVDFCDRERELASPPVLETMDGAAAGTDHAAVALD